MCYRCSICSSVSKPRQKLLRHVLTRTRLGRAEIASELPVCSQCHKHLEGGLAYIDLLRLLSPQPVAQPAPTTPKVLPLGPDAEGEPLSFRMKEKWRRNRS